MNSVLEIIKTADHNEYLIPGYAYNVDLGMLNYNVLPPFSFEASGTVTSFQIQRLNKKLGSLFVDEIHDLQAVHILTEGDNKYINSREIDSAAQLLLKYPGYFQYLITVGGEDKKSQVFKLCFESIIEQPMQLTIIDFTNETVFGKNDGKITAKAIGGSQSSYFYSKNGGSSYDGSATYGNSFLFENLTPSIYGVIAADAADLGNLTQEIPVTIEAGDPATWEFKLISSNILYSVVSSNDDSVLITVGGNGNIYISTDQYSNFSFPSTNPVGSNTLYSVEKISLNNYITVGSGNIISKSTDNGDNWVLITSPIVSTYHKVTFDGNVGYACGDNGVNGTVIRSVDNGDTFVDRTFISDNLKSIYIIPLSGGDDVVAVGDNGVIYRTIDAGNNWSTISSPTAENLTDIIFINSTVGYIVGDNGTVLKSTNAGVNWVSIGDLTVNEDLTGISFIDENDVRVSLISALDVNPVRKSINGGVNWIPDIPDLSSLKLRDIDLINVYTGYACGNNASNAGFICKLS